MRRYFKGILLVLCLIGVARFCHRETAGFRMSKIRDNCGPASALETPLPIDLQGKYTYLGRGMQSFVFLSPDGTHVLKVLNNAYQRKLRWMRWFSAQESERLQAKLAKVFSSYQLAWEELRAETGLLYLHLTPTTHLQRQIELVDKLGIAHPLNLDETAFIVQRKATLAYPFLKALRAQGDLARAEQALRNLLALLHTRCQKGIADNDPLIRTNVGFVGSSPVLIDVGPFSKNDAVRTPAIYLPEIDRITASLKVWLAQNFPELAPALDAQLQELHENAS